MQYISGEVVTEDKSITGYFTYTKNQIGEFSKGRPPQKPIVSGIIIPTVINAHTHIGDSYIQDKNIDLPRDIQELVGPPHGLKHRLLHEASEQEIIQGIVKSLDVMKRCGTAYFCDFREGGLNGIFQLKKAMQNSGVGSLILSRPQAMNYDKTEIDQLLQNSEGIGLSSILDWEYDEVRKIARHVKQKKKIFALHASEAQRENIDLVLDLHPDCIVHMVQATESDLLRVKQENIPVVICPKSNAFFQLKRDYSLLKKTKVKLLLGTDNGMLNSLDVLEEIRFLRSALKVFSLHELFRMCTYTPRKALNLDDGIHGPNPLDNFIVLDKETLQPVYIVNQGIRG